MRGDYYVVPPNGACVRRWVRDLLQRTYVRRPDAMEGQISGR